MKNQLTLCILAVCLISLASCNIDSHINDMKKLSSQMSVMNKQMSKMIKSGASPRSLKSDKNWGNQVQSFSRCNQRQSNKHPANLVDYCLKTKLSRTFASSLYSIYSRIALLPNSLTGASHFVVKFLSILPLR